jgi:ADP-ribose pyrophosphatase
MAVRPLPLTRPYTLDPRPSPAGKLSHMPNPDPTPSQNQVCFSTPWVQLLAIPPASQKGFPHYALASRDYVSVIALDEENRVLLVKQFRPAVGGETIEFPAGHVDDGQTPEQSALQELLEETGYSASHIHLLGVTNPDTGRLMNKNYCYFASGLKRVHAQTAADEVAQPLALPIPEFYALIANNGFNHAQHLAHLMLAVLQGKLPLPGPASKDSQ